MEQQIETTRAATAAVLSIDHAEALVAHGELLRQEHDMKLKEATHDAYELGCKTAEESAEKRLAVQRREANEAQLAAEQAYDESQGEVASLKSKVTLAITDGKAETAQMHCQHLQVRSFIPTLYIHAGD